jgi:hypothetical protein
MNTVASWALAIGFLGVVLITCVHFHSFSQEQRGRYRWFFIASIILIGGSTITQLTTLG